MRRMTMALVASLLAAAGSARAGAPEARAELKVQQGRIAKIEARLATVVPEGLTAEMSVTRAKAMLDLSRRYLKAENASVARLHADLAERLLAVAEGKGVQP